MALDDPVVIREGIDFGDGGEQVPCLLRQRLARGRNRGLARRLVVAGMRERHARGSGEDAGAVRLQELARGDIALARPGVGEADGHVDGDDRQIVDESGRERGYVLQGFQSGIP